MGVDVSAGLRAPPLSRWELATGYALGTEQGEPPSPHPSAPAGLPDPRVALEAAILPALTRSPCFVSFSGGRDSSAVLAVAAALARREGLAAPVPVTLRFPGVEFAEESAWQELVIGHLGLRDWERIELDAELDLLGLVARDALLTHGLLWPPNAHFHVPIMDQARGGALLTGLDGDGLFGDWRWARAQSVLHLRVAPGPRDPLRVALALAPPRLRGRWMRTPLLRVVPWIRPRARAQLAAMARTDAAREPRRWDARISYYRRRRYLSLGVRAFELLGQRRGVVVHHPLLDSPFIDAVARQGGAAGYGDRTAAMRSLFSDLLPDELLGRRGKAVFGRALWKQESREFAAAWDGSGVDVELVDPERLRETWRMPSPIFGAGTLLQQAWLSAQPK